MKKRIVSLTLVSLFCAVGMLSGCSFHEHTLSTRLSYDENYHYYEATCEHKGVKRGISHHEMGVWIILKKPTCQQEGRKKASCVCGYSIEEQLPIDENNHVYAKVLSYDEDVHYRAAICEHSDLRIEEEEHTLAHWTTLQIATCMNERIERGRCKCGYEKLHYSPINENVHVYSTEWAYNERYHFHPAICSHTRFCQGESPHSFSDWELVKAPTCMEEGEERRSCFCGYYETRPIEISSESER